MKNLLTIIKTMCYDFDMRRTEYKTKLSIILLLWVVAPMIFLISCGSDDSSFSENSDTTESTELSGCALWCDQMLELCPVDPSYNQASCIVDCDIKLQNIDDQSCNGLDLTAFDACSVSVFACQDLVACFDYVQCDTDPND